jgi:hypothetical protein
MWGKKKASLEVQNLLDRARTNDGLVDLQRTESKHAEKEKELVSKLRQNAGNAQLRKHYLTMYKLNKQASAQNRMGQVSLQVQANRLEQNYMSHNTITTMMTTNKSSQQLEKHMQQVDMSKVVRDNVLTQQRLQREADRLHDTFDDMVTEFDEDNEADELLMQQIADQYQIEELHQVSSLPRTRLRPAVGASTATAAVSESVRLDSPSSQ